MAETELQEPAPAIMVKVATVRELGGVGGE